jgi:hypothetical protein
MDEQMSHADNESREMEKVVALDRAIFEAIAISDSVAAGKAAKTAIFSYFSSALDKEGARGVKALIENPQIAE